MTNVCTYILNIGTSGLLTLLQGHAWGHSKERLHITLLCSQQMVRHCVAVTIWQWLSFRASRAIGRPLMWPLMWLLTWAMAPAARRHPLKVGAVIHVRPCHQSPLHHFYCMRSHPAEESVMATQPI